MKLHRRLSMGGIVTPLNNDFVVIRGSQGIAAMCNPEGECVEPVVI